ncbi:MAG: adenylate/guanylate cyclase domain-containing protein [Paracoccaceae bacterium]|nr:MAG: adenylate/guanylate cyclase domain-containing protein [Paracoccaceae bacterium]
MTERLACAILFADIVGSTRLYEMLGDERALAVVNACMEAMTLAVEAQHGRVVKTIGDAVMATFPAAEPAFLGAMDLRRRINALPAIEAGDRPIRPRVRVGLHFGQALREHDDYFGDAVNVAARMSEMASAGQILTTGDLLDQLAPYMRALATEFAEIEVKGRHDPVRVARVADDSAAKENTLVSLAAPAPPRAAEISIALSYRGRRLRMDAQSRRILFGREAGCDVILTGPSASRQHATIELRRDKVILIDHSSNGTCLILGADRPIRLRREEFGLINSGRIVFGTPEAADADVLDFTIGQAAGHD